MNNVLKLYTVTEAATVLRVKPKTVRRRILAGHIVAVRPPRAKAWLIPEFALRETINQEVR